MALVRMLSAGVAYPDGMRRKIYEAGNVYDVDGNILEAFFEQGIVEMVEEKKKPAAAPENKAAKPPRENKKAS